MDYYPYLGKVGFDTSRYICEQSRAIIDRSRKFKKLYLEFGGKLMYDLHAARVLPGYRFNAKMDVIRRLAEDRSLEFVFCISAKDIQSNKQSSLNLSYRDLAIRMIKDIETRRFTVGAVVITLYSGEPAAKEFGRYLSSLGYEVYYRDYLPGYPENLRLIASEEGFGKPPYIETKSSIVVITGSGPGSGKMSTALTMIYQDYLRGIDSGYVKYETFPVWDLQLNDPINVAYESATADLGDYNVIDPYHLHAYGVRAVNYNRDVESFIVIKNLLSKIVSEDNFMNTYKSPTDMGINRISDGITDLDHCHRAAEQEVIRRYYWYLRDWYLGLVGYDTVERAKSIMDKLGLDPCKDRVVVRRLLNKKRSVRYSSLQLPSGRVVISREKRWLSAPSNVVLRGLEILTGRKLRDEVLSSDLIGFIRKLKSEWIDQDRDMINVYEALLTLYEEENDGSLLAQLKKLWGTDLHANYPLSQEEERMLTRLGLHVTYDIDRR